MAESAERVDWPQLMRLGLGALGLPPDVFWAMTPVEFRAALEGRGLIPIGARGAMDGQALADLMAAYPDARPAPHATKEADDETTKSL